ncbi:unnamed protein product [Prorocentrum cordatum]|uniref:EF-hand domain-containing protein n=1 Tax=Prorocentrum cordatum TaxID=2364126 RepID=A0ABN9PQC7_9DINO|nr:unnamed protein product [Polarella glacialis]
MVDLFKQFLIDKTGNPLKGWLQFFDKNGDSKVDRLEFEQSLEKMGYDGSAAELFDELDLDESGSLSISEVDIWSSQTWSAFKRWCVHAFRSKDEFVSKLCKDYEPSGSAAKGEPLERRGDCASVTRQHTREESSPLTSSGKMGRAKSLLERSRTTGSDMASGLTTPRKGRTAIGRSFTVGHSTESEVTGFIQQQFVENASRMGWYGGLEMMLFTWLDIRGVGLVKSEDVSVWFDAEHAFQQRRMAFRKKRTQQLAQALGNRTGEQAQHALKAFKVFLRSKWRCLFHAWRSKLDRDGSMTVARKEVWRTCSELGWHGDVSALWHSLDCDDSGSCTLDEFTLAEARPLAVFKRAAEERYGSVVKQFRALLKAAKVKGPGGRLDKVAWCAASHQLGCKYDAPLVFDLVDWEEAGSLCLRDLRFMDVWVPEVWLAEQPDSEAAEDFKRALLQHHGGSVVRAWRVGLDRDGTGLATYKEFKLAAQKIGFEGNVPGAFLALDSDFSGCIGLDELNPDAANELRRFRHWAHQMFGCVVMAFEVLDEDRSDSVSRKEFRRVMKSHCYKGDLEHLFNTLDSNENGHRTGLGRG